MIDTAIQRTPVNPWPWSGGLGYHQAERIEGARVQLVCAGQTAVDGEGNPRHEGDMRAQIALALDNLETVLRAGGMGWADVVRLLIMTTDAGAAPPQTLIGVARLALPPLMIEFEATAMR